MTEKLIDVWDIEPLDDALLAYLHVEANLVRDYMATERKNLLQREASDKTQPYPTNPYARAYYQLVEHIIMPSMEKRAIRAWHYTRLTDREVEQLRIGGVYIPTIESIRKRLDAQVSEGLLSTETAAAIYAASPFHNQNELRANKFWMTSHPLSINDGDVTLLLENWGGEGIYFWLTDPKLIEAVKGIGRPRVIEVAVPLDATNHAYSAAKAVVATFARTLGCESDNGAFSLYSTRALGPAAVLGVHTEGDPAFVVLGQEYPAKFVDCVGRLIL